jgi:hypothetical protein
LYGRVTYKHKQQSEKTWYGKKHGLLGDVQKKLSYVSVTCAIGNHNDRAGEGRRGGLSAGRPLLFR